MRKIFLLVFCMILLIGNVSALNWDNSVDYENNNMTVIITNWFGVGEKLGEATLTSHKTPTEIKDVLSGENRAVMYYEFNEWETYTNGLGEVIFKDMKKGGEEIEKDYYFAKAVYEETIYPHYKTECNNNILQNGSIEKNCIQINTENKTKRLIKSWERLETNEIPSGSNTIGLITEVKLGDYIDGIWTIAGKQVARHASWTEGLNTDLVAYYNFDEGSGSDAGDDTEQENNITLFGSPTWITDGLLGGAIKWSGVNSQYGNITETSAFPGGTDDFAFQFWANFSTSPSSLADQAFIANAHKTGNEFFMFLSGGSINFALDQGLRSVPDPSWNTATWYQIVFNRNGNNLTTWRNGTILGEFDVTGSDFIRSEINVGLRKIDDSSAMNGMMDEVGIWNRSLTNSEISDLYNGGLGITHTNIFDTIAPNVTANNPTNTTYGTTILFNVTAVDGGGMNSCKYTFNNGKTNYTMTNTTTSPNDYTLTNSTMTIGNFEVKYFCEDVNGNENNSIRTSFRTVSTPTVILITPTNNTKSITNNITMNCNSNHTIGVIKLDLLIDGIVNYTLTNSTAGENLSLNTNVPNLSEGVHTWNCNANNGISNGTGALRTFEINTTPNIEYKSSTPHNNSNLIINTFEPNVSLTETYFKNLTFELFNSSGIFNRTTYTDTTRIMNYTNIPDGTYTYNATIYTTTNQKNSTNTRTISINTTPNIELTNPTPSDSINLNVPRFRINISLTETYFKNLTFELFNSSGIFNRTTYTDTTRIINYTNIPDGTYTYNATLYTTTNQKNSTNTRTISIDSSNPIINVTSPNGAINYYKKGNNLTLNWSVSDDHLETCWYEYNSTNTTLTCGDNNFSFLPTSQLNLTFYANDTYANENSESTSWYYIIQEISESYTSSTVEGNTETFTINITINSSAFTNQEASLIYNGTSNTGTKTGSGDSLLFTKELVIPNTNVQTNFTFYWNIILNNGTDYPFNSTPHNQSVIALEIDNCASYPNVLYNFTIVDEKSQSFLNPTNQNTSGKLNLQVYTLDRNTQIINFTSFYNKINPFQICSSSNLSGTNYSIDLEVEYTAKNYSQEFYHIQNDTLNKQDLNTNITLYNLDSANAQEFKITFKDQSFLPVAEVLIQVQRKYIDEGVFKTVEIPITDYEGKTIANLELNDVKYTFIVLKNGELLAVFEDKIPVCDNVLIDDCEINLNSFGSSTGPGDFTKLDDFIFTLDYNRTSRIIKSVFSVPSGTQSTVVLNATLFDSLGNKSVCDDVLTSSSGTLTCNVPLSFGNGSVIVTVKKDGVVIGGGITSLAQTSKNLYGSNIAFLGVFILLTLIGIGISSSPMITGFFVSLGVILNIVLNLTDTGTSSFIGAGATILWLFIAIIIVLIKGAKR